MFGLDEIKKINGTKEVLKTEGLTEEEIDRANNQQRV